jgi:hypothetical protein
MVAGRRAGDKTRDTIVGTAADMAADAVADVVADMAAHMKVHRAQVTERDNTRDYQLENSQHEDVALGKSHLWPLTSTVEIITCWGSWQAA